MICEAYGCDLCKNKTEKIDGWLCTCKAYPEGIPESVIFSDKTENEHCKNGFKFEKRKEDPIGHNITQFKVE